jgi:hypothetical protein
MKTYFSIALVVLSFLGSARAESPDSPLLAFGHQVELELNQPNFDPKVFCDRYWLPTRSSICQAIPWNYVVKNGMRLKKVIETQNKSMGFAVFEIKGVMNQLFTVTLQEGRLFLSLDDSQVWQQYTQDWPTKDSLKFTSPPTEKLALELKASMDRFHQNIQSRFQIHQRSQIPFYFLNSQTIASDLGFIWDDNKLGGGARDGFILIIGDVQKNLRSTLLHEMVHSYTVYPGEFWKGPGVFSNALLSEGLATWIQIPEAWHDDVPKALMARLLCNDITNVRQKLDSQFFDLLDNNRFRSFDGQSGSFKSGYVAGAALIAALMKVADIQAFKDNWNQIGRETDSDQIKVDLFKMASERQLIENMKDYLNWFESEIQSKANIRCAE